MSKVKIALSLLAIIFGIFMFVFGEIDDSPGGQLLGATMFAAGIIGLIRIKKKHDPK